MTTVFTIIFNFIYAIVLVGAIIILVRDDRTREKRVAKFDKVSLQQFRADWEKIMDMPSDCADGMYITDKIYENIKLPTRATKGSAGYDFYSPTTFTLMPNKSITFPTGICVEIEPNWVLKIYPRSGLGFKTGVRLANTVGILDGDYVQSDNEGHIMMKFVNHGSVPMHVEAGDRVAQGVFVPYGITYDDDVTAERNGGFGSSGR